MESKSITLVVRFKDADGKWKRKPVARGAKAGNRLSSVISVSRIQPSNHPQKYSDHH
jgi:hypothetical protein